MFTTEPQFTIRRTDPKNLGATFLAFMFFAISVATALLYSQALHDLFLLDDTQNIKPAIMQEFSWNGFWTATLSNSSGELKRPISAASFAITSLLHGDVIWGFKYHNLLLHLLNGFLIFLLCFVLQKKSAGEHNTDIHKIYALSIAMSLIWLVHPLHVSTVLYSVQRMTQLAAVFSFTALICYVIARTSKVRRQKLVHYFVLVPFFSLAALLSKENAVLLVFFILLTHYFLTQSDVRGSTLDTLAIWCSSIFPIMAGFTVFAIKHERFLNYSTREFTLYERVLTQIDVVLSYLQNLVLPRLSNMGLYLDDTVIRTSWSGELFVKLLILSAIFILGLIQLKKGRLFGFGILFFFVGHLLESTILPLELAFEHRNYLPSMGICIAIVALVSNAINSKKAAALALVLFTFMLTSLLALRVSFWSDEENWLKTTLAYSPNSERTQLDYLARIANIEGPEAGAKASLKVSKAIPDKISFKLLYLLYGCKSDQLPFKQSVASDILDHLENRNLTVSGFNHLGALIQQVSITRCNSLSMSKAFELIDSAIYNGPKKSDRLKAKLYFVKGMLVSSQGLPIQASNLYKLSYQLHSLYRYKLASIKVLLAQPSTQSKGAAMLIEELNKLESLSLQQQKSVLEIKEKVNTGNVNYIF